MVDHERTAELLASSLGRALQDEQVRLRGLVEKKARAALDWLASVPSTRRVFLFINVSATHPPQSPGRRHVRILYAAQTSVAPPTFALLPLRYSVRGAVGEL